jgi:hypothetical protein
MNPELVYPVIECSEIYKADHDGLYADSLKNLALAQGENCIYPFSIDGSSPSAKIGYQPLLDAAGRVTGYSIILGGTRFWGRFSPDGSGGSDRCS